MKFISLALACTLFSACGKDDDSTNSPAALTTQESASTNSASNLDESMNILSDSDQETSGTALTLNADVNKTRACAVDGDAAKVSVTWNFSNEAGSNGKFANISQKIDMSAELTRVWKKSGSSIACNSGNTHVALDLSSDLTGLTTDVTYKRSHERAASRTAKNGTITTRSVKAVTAGTRSIVWSSSVVNVDTTVTRSKSVASTGTSTRTVIGKDGISTQTSFSVATASDAPLAVEVTYPSALASEPSSRMIKSGKLIATAAGSGRVESTFENLNVSFSASACAPESGNVINRVFAEGATEASVVIKIEAAGGTYTATDITDASNPKEIEDFEYQLCDVKSFNN